MPKSPEEIFRDTIAPGSPARYNPPKADIRELLRYMLDLITGISVASGLNPALVSDFKNQLTLQITNSLSNFESELASDQIEIDRLKLGLLSYLSGAQRPSENLFAFTNTALGSPTDNDPLNAANIITSAFGRAYKIDGSGTISPRSFVVYDPNAIYVVRAIIWRLNDVLDPNNNALDFGIQWLDGDNQSNGYSLIKRETNLKVQDGLKIFEYRVPSMLNDIPELKAPKNTVAWRPYIFTYGRDGSTAVQLLSAQDITYTTLYSPDVADIAARLRTVEGSLAAGLPLSTPILPAYTVAELQTMVPTFGRKAMASDGRAPDAAGVLEAPNAGKGVEVTGNGTKWCISGTNQAVQA